MRTNYCGFIDKRYLGQMVTVAGWVHHRRDHGKVIFIDLRDREGLVQVVIDPETLHVLKIADACRNEFVLQITGLVRDRPPGTVNSQLRSGEIEILGKKINVLNTAQTPPFHVDEENPSENTRLNYRVIDLRRETMQKNLRLRHQITRQIRHYLDQEGFIDIETPVLTRSTPEGARDYLVPSRVNKGQFFALPQSPQLFKQLLMLSGFDRYYQIVKCFRDEDLRADRQPEFTQIDLETSFLDETQIMHITEKMVRSIFQNVLHVDLPVFPCLSYDEAIRDYGSDKPDLRIPLKFIELTDTMKTEKFKVFANAAAQKEGRIAALRIPGHVALTRSEIDAYTQFVAQYGAKGLAYIKVNDITQPNEQGLQSPIVKNLSEACLRETLKKSEAQDGDWLFFIADIANIVNEAMGAFRLKIAHDKGLVRSGWCPVWVVEFPMFEFDSETKRWVACHHPFTSPKQEHLTQLSTQPGQCRARAYDFVLNGWEIGSGSIRIHQAEVQANLFSALGMSEKEANDKFGFLLDNLKYGAPPHGGIALGLDRLTALMSGASSIRDVIAFPKTQRAQCLLTQAPNSVSEQQLRELSIRLSVS